MSSRRQCAAVFGSRVPCYSPLKGFRSKVVSKNGLRPIVFNPALGYVDLPVEVPCGQCVGCRLERSRQWAVRCVHEASLHEQNCFITLTYNDDHLPDDRSLNLKHFQDFMKRLRKRFGAGIRFYHCGEYGEQLGRPHYHALLFNFDFKDKVPFKVLDTGVLYRSAALEELWPFGFSSIGSVTFESAAYVARYIMKKITGPEAAGYYQSVDANGVITERKPEYTTMSRRPGIGKGWLDKFGADVLRDDFVVLRGRKMRPPKFYDRQFEITDPDLFQSNKIARKRAAKLHIDDQTPDRLSVRERLHIARLKKLPRKLE